MIVEYIRYDLKAHGADELIAAYGEAAEYLRAAPECVGYELSQCVEDPNQVTLRICWNSAEEHMQGFRKGPNFPPFLAAIRPFIGEILEMRHYRPTAVAFP